MSDRGVADGAGHDNTPCAHAWTYREIGGETWNVCVRCGFGEQWAKGLLIASTDDEESARLEALALRDPPGAGWQE